MNFRGIGKMIFWGFAIATAVLAVVVMLFSFVTQLFGPIASALAAGLAVYLAHVWISRDWISSGFRLLNVPAAAFAAYKGACVYQATGGAQGMFLGALTTLALAGTLIAVAYFVRFMLIGFGAVKSTKPLPSKQLPPRQGE